MNLCYRCRVTEIPTNDFNHGLCHQCSRKRDAIRYASLQAEQRARIREMNAAYDWDHRHELVAAHVTHTEP